MALASLRVPAIITCSIVFFALGIGAGTLTMGYFGYHWERESGERTAGGSPDGAPKGMPGGGPGMPAMPGMPGGGGGGKGKQGPNSKAQLEALVLKLDQLTTKPLQVTLNDEQKKKVREQLQGLGDMKELSEDDAKKRLDALTEILKDQRETMEAAGYRWPGAGGGFGGGGQKKQEAANPFKEGKTGERLKALEAALGKG